MSRMSALKGELAFLSNDCKRLKLHPVTIYCEQFFCIVCPYLTEAGGHLRGVLWRGTRVRRPDGARVCGAMIVWAGGCGGPGRGPAAHSDIFSPKP